MTVIQDPEKKCPDCSSERIYFSKKRGVNVCRDCKHEFSAEKPFIPMRIVSWASDNTVRMSDVHNSECLHVLEGHTRTVNGVTFSPDGTRIVSGSSDGTVRLWDTDSDKCLNIFQHETPVNSVAFSSDGTRIVSGGDGVLRGLSDLGGVDVSKLTGIPYPFPLKLTVHVWDTDSGDCLHSLVGHTDSVNSVMFSPDSTRIVSGSSDGTVRVWDYRSGECLRTFKGHRLSVNSVMFSSDGTNIISRSSDSTVCVWDADTGKCLEIIEGENSVAAIAAGTEVHPLRAICRKGKTVIEDASTGEALVWFTKAFWCITTHPSKRICAGGVGKYVCLVRL